VEDDAGEGEEALAIRLMRPVWDLAAVALEGELVFERVEDRLGPLTDVAEGAEAGWFVSGVGVQQAAEIADMGVRTRRRRSLCRRSRPGRA